MTNDKVISVGDLVQVVRSCCEKVELVGIIYTVGVLHSFHTRCQFCGQENKNVQHASSGMPASDTPIGLPVSWLKRIPPLSELEGERTEENLKEPA